MFAVGGKDWNCIKTRPVVVKLPLQPCVLARVDEIPETSCAAVVTPMRNRRHISKNRVECDIGLVLIAKIFGPGIDLFLSGRVPWHLTAKGIWLFFPPVGARPHCGLQRVSLLSHAFTPEVVQNQKEYVAFHLSEAGVDTGKFVHRNCCLVSM